jgi:hypothetical protein
MLARKECRASARAGRVPSFPPQTLKGTGREREGCCGPQQGLIRRIHPFDPRHDPLHELLRDIVQHIRWSCVQRRGLAMF